MNKTKVLLLGALLLARSSLATAWTAGYRGLRSEDLYALQSVGDVAISPDGTRIVYAVVRRDRPGRPYAVLWIRDPESGNEAAPLGEGRGFGYHPRWSPDGKRLAYLGTVGDRFGVVLVGADGRSPRLLADVEGTNHPLPGAGSRLAWSPDGRTIAFLSATPGPESEEAGGDPVIIRRYLYKPTASEGGTRFNDNRRLHIFTVDVESGRRRQLTDGIYYEHSIDWSPRGNEIAFVSNREPDPDRFFNYDLFAVEVLTGSVRRITRTESVEYRPRWSPDGARIAYQGTRRGLTSSETTMEDTHIWTIRADGTEAREIGAGIDDRQGEPAWTFDGTSVVFTVEERGSEHLLELPATGGRPRILVGGEGSVESWSLSRGGGIAYAFHASDDLAQLFLRKGGEAARRLTDLNAELWRARERAETEVMPFVSFDGTAVEAFLTLPLGREEGTRHPLIAMIKGGPHSQRGPELNPRAQIFAAQGWATIQVNYRGSTGYGQAFADAIFGDQNGGEAKDVLYGVEAALRRYAWLDPERLGIEGSSYGGQLTNWIITQTDRFKAAIPMAGISNLLSFNYMSYYHDYLAVEFWAYPHQDDLMDLLWDRSPLKHVAQVKTPTLLVHGENDNDVPIAEAEQFYIALKDVGVETLMLRYPREGHGVHESQHVVDLMDRSLAWYTRHFGATPGKETRPTASR